MTSAHTEADTQTTPGGDAAMMRAVVHTQYGAVAADVLRCATVSRPTVGEDDVLVRVHASSVDRGTWHIMAGLPLPIRLAGFGIRAPRHLNPGRCLAGTVTAIGTAVQSFQVGDRVFGTSDGTFAEYVTAHPDRLALIPSGLSFMQAAAMPVSGVTALQAVRDHGRVSAGQHVLVVGASGGVGTFAVQIAKAFGARVAGVCGPTKTELVHALGADDVILDIGGNSSLRRLRRALVPQGTCVIVGGETSGRLLGGFDRTLRALMLTSFISQDFRNFIASENGADLQVLGDLVEAGHLAPALDHIFALSEAAAAVQHVAGGHARGKTVITI